MPATAQPPAAPDTAAKLKARRWMLKNFRVFAAGVAHGKPWTESDIDDIVRNGEQFAGLVRPTLVIGHEETQPLVDGLPATATQNSGEPAFGRLINLRKDHWLDENGQPVVGLACDAVDMPGWLAVLLAGKSLIDRSAEIYDKPPDGLEKAKGAVLRRVSLLGGELPQIKNLGDMPEPELQTFTEEPVLVAPRRALKLVATTFRGGSTIFRFSECQPMPSTAVRVPRPVKAPTFTTRTKTLLRRFAEPRKEGADPVPLGFSRGDLVGMLVDFGVNPDRLDDLPANALAEMLRVLSAGADVSDGDGTGPTSAGTDPLINRSNLISEAIGFGMDPTLVETMDTDALAQCLECLAYNGAKPMDDPALAQRFAERFNRNPSVRRFGSLTKDTIMKTYAAEKSLRPGLTLAQHLLAQ